MPEILRTPSPRPGDSSTDEEIVGRVLAGEKELYEVIIRRHNQRLFRISRGYVRDPNDAEEIVQQAYINAYEHLAAFEGRARFSTWLIAILIREAMRKKNEQRLTVQFGGDVDGGDARRPAVEPSAGTTPADTVVNDELRAVLERTIDGLPPIYRAVFVMREMEGFSVEETRTLLGITASNVKVRLNRAKEMLRREIGGIYKDAGGKIPAHAGVYHFDLVRCDSIVTAVLAAVERYSPRPVVTG